MGGRLAMLYLKAHPGRVRGLVLLGAPPPLSFPITREDTLQARRNDSRFEEFAGRSIVRIEWWRQKEGGKVFYDAESAEAASCTVDSSVVKGIRPALRRTAVPTHVIIGDHDFVDMGAL